MIFCRLDNVKCCLSEVCFFVYKLWYGIQERYSFDIKEYKFMILQMQNNTY